MVARGHASFNTSTAGASTHDESFKDTSTTDSPSCGGVDDPVDDAKRQMRFTPRGRDSARLGGRKQQAEISLTE